MRLQFCKTYVIELQIESKAYIVHSVWHTWYMHWLQLLMDSEIMLQESLLVFKCAEKNCTYIDAI